MMNQGIWLSLVVLAVIAAVWFRSHPMSDWQRKVAVGVAIALMGTTFLRPPVSAGTIGLVVCGAVVLVLALVFLQRQNKSPD